MSDEINNKYFVYILKSTHDSKCYVGMSNDVARRLKEHNCGGTKSTKARAPFELVYTESFSSRIEARKREKYFRSAAGRRFLKGNKII